MSFAVKQRLSQRKWSYSVFSDGFFYAVGNNLSKTKKVAPRKQESFVLLQETWFSCARTEDFFCF